VFAVAKKVEGTLSSAGVHPAGIVICRKPVIDYVPLRQSKDIISTLESADLVITRAGMNTIATLLALEKMSLIIPLPITSNNEQQRNALFLRDHRLAEILQQKNANSQNLLALTHDMIKNRKEYKNNAQAQELSHHKYAAENIISILTLFK
jgi:UDP-N-acetylglucosamine:LPS N-acetylglucosamine transferase